jgi:hypothetical protein
MSRCTRQHIKLTIEKRKNRWSSNSNMSRKHEVVNSIELNRTIMDIDFTTWILKMIGLLLTHWWSFRLWITRTWISRAPLQSLTGTHITWIALQKGEDHGYLISEIIYIAGKRIVCASMTWTIPMSNSSSWPDLNSGWTMRSSPRT